MLPIAPLTPLKKGNSLCEVWLLLHPANIEEFALVDTFMTIIALTTTI